DGAARKALGEEEDLDALQLACLRVVPADHLVGQPVGVLTGVGSAGRDMEDVSDRVVVKDQLRRHARTPAGQRRAMNAVTIHGCCPPLASSTTTTMTCLPSRSSGYQRP